MDSIAYDLFSLLDQLASLPDRDSIIDSFVASLNQLHQGFSLSFQLETPAPETPYMAIQTGGRFFGYLLWEGDPEDVAPGFLQLLQHGVQMLAILLQGRFQEALSHDKGAVPDALAISQQQYQAVVQDLPALVCRNRPDGIIEFVNDAYCRYFGKTRHELVGHNFFELIPEDDREQVRANLGRLSATEPIQVHEHRVINDAGAIRYQRWTNRAILDLDGDVVCIQAYGEDITEQKLAKQRQQLYTTILTILNRTNAWATLIAEILRAIKDFTGFEAVGLRLCQGDDFPYYETSGFPEPFVEKERFLCLRDEDGRLVRNENGSPMLACLCGCVIGGQGDPDLDVFTENGSFWTNSTSELSFDISRNSHIPQRKRCYEAGYESMALIPLRSGGDVIGLLQLNDSRKGCLTLELVTFFESVASSIGIAFARRRIQEALEESDRALSTLLGNLPGIAYRCHNEPNWPFEFVSQGTLALTGYTPEDFMSGRVAFGDLIHPEDRERVWRQVQQALQVQQAYELEYRILTREGLKKKVWERGCSVSNSEGGIIALEGFVWDITEREQTAELSRIAQERLKLIYDTTTDLMALFSVEEDGDYRFVSFNQAYWEAVRAINPDTPREALMGASVYDLVKWIHVSQSTVEGFTQYYRKAKETCTSVKLVESIVTPLGTLYLDSCYTPIFDVHDNCTHILFVAHDVTARKQAEEDLELTRDLTERKNITLAAINQLFRESITCKTRSDVARVCLSIAERVTGSQYGSIAEVNHEGRFDTLALSNPGWEICRVAELDPSCIQGMEIRGIWGAALNSEHGLIVNDPSHHPLRVGLPEGHPALHSFLGVPIEHKSFRGMIGLANREEGYTETERETIEALVYAFAEMLHSKSLDEAVWVSEERLREAQHIARIGSFEQHIHRDILYWSRELYGILGFDPDQPPPDYQTFASRIHPDDRADVDAQVARAFKDGTGPVTFYRYTMPDGTMKYISARAKVTFDPQGNPECLVGTAQDITDLKETEKALQESEGRFRGMFESKMVGTIFWNAEGDITDANDAFLAMVGYSRDDVLSGRVRWRDMTPPEYTESDNRALEEIKASGVMTPMEKEYICSDGRRLPILLGAASLPGPQLGGVAFVLDISERKKAAEAFRQAQEALLRHQRDETKRVADELAKAKEELVRKTRLAAIGQVSASMAHDLRNPLGAARNACYLLRRRQGGGVGEMSEPIDIIEQEIVRADQIISNLLSIARSRSPEKEAIDLEALVDTAWGRLENCADVDLQIHLQSNPFIIQVDRDLFLQVVSNIIDNAIQAMDGSGQLMVTAHHNQECDVIEFMDFGPGIAPEIKESLFDPLVTTKTRGTGLGLTICKQIVEAHGGTIEAVNDIERGARISIVLSWESNQRGTEDERAGE